jgi:hypothetical protein
MEHFRRHFYLDLPEETICLDVPYVPPTKARPAPKPVQPFGQVDASGCITNMTWDGTYTLPSQD